MNDSSNGSVPWHQQPGESYEAYAAFEVYRDLGPERSVDAAWRFAQKRDGRVNASDRASGCWRRWTTNHDWQSRALAWDMRLQQAADQGRLEAVTEEAKAAERARLLDERRIQQEEDEWRVSTKLIEQAEQIMAAKLYRQKTTTSPNAEPIVEIVPARWSKSTAVQMLELAMRLRRLSLRMPAVVKDAAKEDSDPWENQLFETDGQFEAAMPPGTVQPMPEDVLEKPPMPQPESFDGIIPRLPPEPVRP